MQIEIEDKFVKTDTDINQSNLHSNYVEQKLFVTSYGVPLTGKHTLTLAESKFNIDSSGLTQYTSYQPYLDFIFDGIKKQVDLMDKIDGNNLDQVRPDEYYEKFKVYPPKIRI